jgi:predicted phage tail protein
MSADRDLGATFTRKPLEPPDTVVTKAKIKAKQRTASFRFRSMGSASGFQCRLISKKHRKPPFRACSSPKTFRGLKPGRYRFEVRAVNSSGPDPTPAKKKFKLA